MDQQAVDRVLAMGGSEPDGGEPAVIMPPDSENGDEEYVANMDWMRGQENAERIAGHLQVALTEVRACLPGKQRTVSVGAREFTADDVRALFKEMRRVKTRLGDLITHLYSTGGHVTNEKLLEWTEDAK